MPTWLSGPLTSAALTVIGVAVVLAVGTVPLLRRLPEPGPEHPGYDPDKIAYRVLARPAFVVGCSLAGAVAASVVVSVVPAPLRPPWLVLASAGVLLAGIDAVTTWLPWRLTWPAWAATAVAGGVCLLLGVPSWPVLRLLIGGVLAWLWYLLVYRLTRRQLGLGDVWLAPLVGAPAALIGFSTLYAALLCGALVGGVQGLVLVLRGHRGGFAYAPAIVSGGFVALLVQPVLRLLGY